jgi:hypothetical protein
LIPKTGLFIDTTGFGTAFKARLLPPKFVGSDIPNASCFARMICATTESVVAFLEHGYQEALALVEQYKTVVQAIAQALLDHPKRTLNTAEIDEVIVAIRTRSRRWWMPPSSNMAASM